MHSLGSPPRSLRNLDRRGEQLRENIDLNALNWLRAWERRRVVYRQQEAGKNPEQESEQRHASKYLVPAGGGGNIFLQKVTDFRNKAGALVEARPRCGAYRRIGSGGV
jgi:hypothetical protein